mgnify:CR=1 FL=1
MQVTKITSPATENMPSAHKMTDKQMRNEINYHRAKQMAKKMQDAGLITSDECDRILAESRKIFVPFLAEIL